MRAQLPLRDLSMAALGVVVAGWLTRDAWLGRLFPSQPAAEEPEGGISPRSRRIRSHARSPQAPADLGLVVDPCGRKPTCQIVRVPGSVVEHRGRSDRGIAGPDRRRRRARPRHSRPRRSLRRRVVHHPADQRTSSRQPGRAEQDRPGAEDRRREEGPTGDRRPRLRSGLRGLADREPEPGRPAAAWPASVHRNELALHSISPEQIDRAEAGQFLTEMTVRMPSAGRPESPGPPIWTPRSTRCRS